MKKLTASPLTMGVDLGDKYCSVCLIDFEGEVVERAQVRTSRSAFEQALSSRPKMRVAIEVGAHSAWVADVVEACGHEVIVANARQLAAVTENVCKNDDNDAEVLARLARSDLKLMKPIKHRPAELRIDLAVIRGRDGMVRGRTTLVNTVRGLVKSAGGRLPKCDAATFHKRVLEAIPPELVPAVEGIVKAIAELTKQIRAADKRIEELAKKYPETELVAQVAGVGTLTALTFVLTLADKKRFKKSRDVGAYLGLVPRQQRSGSIDPQLKITKAGNSFMRRLLVGSAHYVLGRFGPDSDLRRWGLAIAARGGKNGKKRAVVAVARKLAVLMHRLWSTAEVYEPLRNAKLRESKKGSKE